MAPSQSSRLKSHVRRESRSTSTRPATESERASVETLPSHLPGSLENTILSEFDTMNTVGEADMALVTSDASPTAWDEILSTTWDEAQLHVNNAALQMLSFASPMVFPNLLFGNWPTLGTTGESFTIDPLSTPLSLQSKTQHQHEQSLILASPSLDADLENLGHVPELTSETFEDLSTWACTMSRMRGTVDSFSSLSLNTLNAFIQLYFEEFHDILPIIHRPTFDPNCAPYLLVLVVGNIGRRFSKLAEETCSGTELDQFIYHAAQHHVCMSLFLSGCF